MLRSWVRLRFEFRTNSNMSYLLIEKRDQKNDEEMARIYDQEMKRRTCRESELGDGRSPLRNVSAQKCAAPGLRQSVFWESNLQSWCLPCSLMQLPVCRCTPEIALCTLCILCTPAEHSQQSVLAFRRTSFFVGVGQVVLLASSVRDSEGLERRRAQRVEVATHRCRHHVDLAVGVGDLDLHAAAGLYD